MDVKVVYRDGSSEIFRDVKDSDYHPDIHMFRVEYEKSYIMIPEGAVRSVGAGRIETICTVEHGRTTKTEEVFVYE